MRAAANLDQHLYAVKKKKKQTILVIMCAPKLFRLHTYQCNTQAGTSANLVHGSSWK